MLWFQKTRRGILEIQIKIKNGTGYNFRWRKNGWSVAFESTIKEVKRKMPYVDYKAQKGTIKKQLERMESGS